MNIQLKKLTSEDIKLWDVWKKKVDLSLYQTHLWPEELVECTNYRIYLIIVNIEAIGAIWLEKIDIKEKLAWLGIFIGDPDYWGKGYGATAIKLLIEEADTNLGITQLWLNVRGSNQRAIRCYEKVGFKKVRKMGPRIFGDGSFQYWYEMMIMG